MRKLDVPKLCIKIKCFTHVILNNFANLGFAEPNDDNSRKTWNIYFGKPCQSIPSIARVLEKEKIEKLDPWQVPTTKSMFNIVYISRQEKNVVVIKHAGKI